ncbi:chemotaxis protein CheA [Blautia schinkii]|nr:chemotaxis protein CheA [Blautia schinkii]
MGYFDSDALEMLEIYLLETKQLLEQLSAVLISAESKNSFTEEELHSVFRVMHTIKSSSAMMGLPEMSAMAHKLEDLFAYYREEYGRIESAPPELFDLLFMAEDYIESETQAMSGDAYNPQSADEIVKLTEEYLVNLSDKDKETEEEQTIDTTPEEQAAGNPIVPDVFANKEGLVVRVLFETGCRMENIRAFMIMRQITGLCTEVESYPDNLEKSQEGAEYIGKNGVFFRIVGGEKEKLLESIRQGLFVSACEVISEGLKPKEQEPKQPQVQMKSSGNGDSDFLQVRVERLNQLQNLAAELMISTLSLDAALEEKGLMEIREGVFHQINRLIAEVENTVMSMRMVPVSRMVPRLQRILRDICRNQNKEVELVVSCGDIEADKSVVDYVSEALIHILRNAVDHGIEAPEEREEKGKSRKGKIWFQAENSSGELSISVKDDGQGINIETIRRRAREKGLFYKPEEEYDEQELLEMILAPGFTTNEKVTEYSGRGVGLDVVKSVLEDAGGHLYINSVVGEGSTFTITVPLSLATMECTRFLVADYRFSVPARYVFGFFEFDKERNNIREQNGRTYMVYENRMIPLVDLRRFYGLEGETPKNAIIIYVRCVGKEGCILVDSMYTQKRIVVKQLPSLFGLNFRSNTGISGLSVMGSGKICAAIDVEGLLYRYEREGTYGRSRN